MCTVRRLRSWVYYSGRFKKSALVEGDLFDPLLPTCCPPQTGGMCHISATVSAPAKLNAKVRHNASNRRNSFVFVRPSPSPLSHPIVLDVPPRAHGVCLGLALFPQRNPKTFKMLKIS